MTIVVPFHQDERLPAGSLPVPGDRVVTPPLPDGDIWTRLTALHDAVADAVADALAGTVAGADTVVGADADEVADAGAGAVVAGAGVDEVVAAETPPVVVSGDCLVALGVLAGAQRAGTDPSLIWFDA
ncbi:arginase family protein [Actinophytocola sp.]|uniref:arginase family protein n=1 Tax=Actinophytocola sp. TaxID=1872138 RepID=UPI0038998294